MIRPLAMVLVLLLNAGGLFGARPFTVDDAGTVSASAYEVETGLDYQEKNGVLSLGFKHGLTEKMDLGIGLGCIIVSPNEIENRFQPVELCLKYSLLPDLLAVSLATAFETNAYGVNSIMSRAWNRLSLNLDFGVDAAVPSFIYGGSLIYELINGLNLGVETAGDKDGFVSWLAGANYLIKDWLAIDFGFSSDYDFNENLMTVGLHCEF